MQSWLAPNTCHPPVSTLWILRLCATMTMWLYPGQGERKKILSWHSSAREDKPKPKCKSREEGNFSQDYPACVTFHGTGTLWAMLLPHWDTALSTRLPGTCLCEIMCITMNHHIMSGRSKSLTQIQARHWASSAGTSKRELSYGKLQRPLSEQTWRSPFPVQVFTLSHWFNSPELCLPTCFFFDG